MKKTNADDISKGVEILRGGGLVAFPTETVYGLGGDATNEGAIRKIFQVKGRPSNNPLICHVADEETAKRYAREWPEKAARIAEAFWPGAITVVVKKTAEIVEGVTAGLGTVGLRVPKHAVTLQMLKEFGGAVAGPSANRSTRVSPTIARHVRDELGDSVDLILDGGACSVGIESTVLDLSGAVPRILRPGGVSREDIEGVIGEVQMNALPAEAGSPPRDAAMKAPGQMLVHYAPRTPAFRFEVKDRSQLDMTDAAIVELTMDAETYARNLYARLRLLDGEGLRVIYVEMPPDRAEWAAVRDRVMRATKALGEGF